MTRPREVLTHDTAHVGRRVLLFDELPSTNDTVAGQEPGTVVVADHQTAGRGQYGRTWVARPGTSLLMSVCLHPPDDLRRPVLLTAWAAVGVADAVQELTGRRAVIKWPNDLLVDGKKGCGILIEQRATTVVGIGLNLNQSADDFTAAGLPDATSLAMLTGHPIDQRIALTAVVRHLDGLYGRILAGERAVFETNWKARMGLLGRHVVAELSDGRTVTGRLADLGFAGVEIDAGGPAATVVVQPEVVRHLRAT